MEAKKHMILEIQAEVNPTEDPKKVSKAIRNIFGDIVLVSDAPRSLITGKITEMDLLKEFRAKIAQDRIRTTIKNTLTRWTTNGSLSFGLNRQAAYAGHISLNLTNEDPMGPIQVQIKEDAQKVIDFISR
jgi:predicted RNA binding protein with dsRBD fold (UPF0201 family)